MGDYKVHNIALKTLKQRCEYLQQRLNAVEEENCKLKMEKAEGLSSRTSKEPRSLEERIIILNKEKSQMAEQIEMISNENFTLWSQLSKVLPESSISSLKFSLSTVPDNQILKFTKYDKISNDYEKESLEEISLKLINGIIMGKNELEKQYSQMIDLQRENIAEENLSFIPIQFDNKVAVKSLKDYIKRLKDFKQALCEQRDELSSVITAVKNSPFFYKQIFNSASSNSSSHENVFCNRERSVSNVNQLESEISDHQDSATLVNKDEKFYQSDMICPICGKQNNGMFKDFYKHVSDHFDDENDEFLDSTANFDGAQ